MKKSSKTKILEQSIKSNKRITDFISKKKTDASVMDNIDNFDLGESLLNISSAKKKMDLSMIKEAGEEGGS